MEIIKLMKKYYIGGIKMRNNEKQEKGKDFYEIERKKNEMTTTLQEKSSQKDTPERCFSNR